jgi:hypothetical protein
MKGTRLATKAQGPVDGRRKKSRRKHREAVRLGKLVADDAAQFMRSFKPGIPSPHAPNAITVTDGTYCAGTVVESGGSHFAFDSTGTLIGEYATRAEAVNALPDIVGGASS